ncbi:POT-type proton-dependent oligopeptide transporter [Pseudoduganella violacea]|uniref:POT family proton-dependent oligopeptide transporter n=1 Tax=Pseudoduganella violacea TaxID=1715466 RepID=A0A7W5FST6_9BURK|nr:oligopeptide:H+ symporter [Pseudoduganella violacea]MBB3117922.1 POT family proton-dependent oligopeptide transporter [Pseudoduganella violacea]
MSQADQHAGNGPLPRQIPYIIANEGCERFSFYGMRNILTPFLISTLLLFIPLEDRASEAKHVFHTFVIGVYFFPLLGGWLADRFFGKYNTIFWLSLVYVAGHACLAIFEDNLKGFYFGLFLIALGSGGIKPLVSAFVGDQFDQTNKKRAKVVYDAFYWMINFGSFFASLLMPLFLKNYGPAVAFGIPGILMAVATMIFWLGNKKYVHVQPQKHNPDSFTNVARTALLARKPGQSRPGLTVALIGAAAAVASLCMSFSWGFVIAACTALVLLLAFGGIGTAMQLERARGAHPDEAVEGVRAVLRILVVFALVTPFWSLFDQKASTWILQANNMQSPMLSLFGWEFKVLPAQMQAVNPLLVMLLIPFNNFAIFPLLRKIGIEPTPLRRMTAGIALSGLAWIIIGWIQLSMDAGTPMSILWQLLPYAVLTMGEVLVSATGLEFAYSQAPAPMKGSIMSFWTLAVTVGNLWVLIVNSSVKNEAVLGHIATSGMSVIAFQMFFFAGFALLTALAFGLYATRYRMVDNYRSDDGQTQTCYGTVPTKS